MRGSKDTEKSQCRKISQKIWFHRWMKNNEEMEFTGKFTSDYYGINTEFKAL
jgi:hypothetical protein